MAGSVEVDLLDTSTFIRLERVDLALVPDAIRLSAITIAATLRSQGRKRRARAFDALIAATAAADDRPLHTGNVEDFEGDRRTRTRIGPGPSRCPSATVAVMVDHHRRAHGCLLVADERRGGRPGNGSLEVGAGIVPRSRQEGPLPGRDDRVQLLRAAGGDLHRSMIARSACGRP